MIDFCLCRADIPEFFLGFKVHFFVFGVFLHWASISKSNKMCLYTGLLIYRLHHGYVARRRSQRSATPPRGLACWLGIAPAEQTSRKKEAKASFF